MNHTPEEQLSAYQHLPKVELHQHLDCSLSYAAVSQIDPTVTPADYKERFVAPDKCVDLADFLTSAKNSIQLMQTEEQLRIVVQDLFTQLKQDNIIYAEVRFAPLLHTQKGLSGREVVQIVEKAVEKSVNSTGVEARLILCTLRNFSVEQSLDTVKLLAQFQGGYVVGFDIAADEAGFPIDAHIKAFHFARDQNIPCTAHAGEARGPGSVWETLQNFYPTRLGHGVRSIEDPLLLEHLRRNKIHLEICPTCNVQTDIYPDYQAHVVDKLYRAGLSLNINTDTRTMTDITLNQEYQKLNRAFGWGDEQFLQTNLFALQAAFIPEDTRQELITQLLAGY